MDEELFELLGTRNKPENPKPKSRKLMNIFGKKRDKHKYERVNPLRKSDLFYQQIYEFFYYSGFETIITLKITQLLSLTFGIIFSIFMILLLDWGDLLQCNIDCKPLKEYFNFELSTFQIIIIVGVIIFLLYRCIIFAIDIKRLIKIRDFYKTYLNISIKDLQTISWQEIISRLSDSQGLNIDEITNIILRKENFLIALINKKIINIKPKSFTRQFLANIHYVVLNKLHTNTVTLRNRFIIAGFLNLLFLPFILLGIFIHFFMQNIAEINTNKDLLGPRRYSLYALWSFREYNELDHFFEARINKSLKYATLYTKLFPSSLVNIIAKFLALLSGAFVGFFLIISIFDEKVLLYVTLSNRTLLFYAGIAGTVSSLAHSFILSPDTNIFNLYSQRNSVMTKLQSYIRYKPTIWENNGHTIEIHNQFLELFQYKLLLFLYELRGVFTIPFILFELSRQTKNIVEFIDKNTYIDQNIDNICKFANFNNSTKDIEKQRNIEDKADISQMSFFENHSDCQFSRFL